MPNPNLPVMTKKIFFIKFTFMKGIFYTYLTFLDSIWNSNVKMSLQTDINY